MTGRFDTRFRVAWTEGVDTLLGDVRFQEFLGRVRHVSPFVTAPWLRCAAAILVPADRRVHVVTVSRGDRLVAAMALTAGSERLHGVPVRTLRLLGDPLADRSPLLVERQDPGALAALLAAVLRGPLAWDVAVLSELPDDATERTAIDDWNRQHGLAVEWQLSSRVPILDLSGRTPEAIRAAYSKTLRTRLSRSRKRMAQAGTLSVERLLPDPSQVAELIDQIKAIEDASWKGRAGQALFAAGPREQFMRAVSAALAQDRQVEIWLLRLDGVVISYRYGFRFRGAFYDYNLAYLPHYAAVSPGRILLDEIVAGSARDGLTTVDASRASMTTGNLLSDWTDAVIEHHRLRIYNTTLRGRLLHAMRTVARPALRRVQRLLRREGP